MIDHIVLPVSDFTKAKKFYADVLSTISATLLADFSDDETKGAGFGQNGKPAFWIVEDKKAPGLPLHIAFSARKRAEVDAFYQAALLAGGKDNGAPGIREHYHPNYYAAFMCDLDGNNIEMVCHLPE